MDQFTRQVQELSARDREECLYELAGVWLDIEPDPTIGQRCCWRCEDTRLHFAFTRQFRGMLQLRARSEFRARLKELAIAVNEWNARRRAVLADFTARSADWQAERDSWRRGIEARKG